MKYPIEALEAVGTVIDDPLDIADVLDALEERGFRLVQFHARKNEGRERVARLVARKVYLEFEREKAEKSTLRGKDTEVGMINAEIASLQYVLDIFGVDISTPEKELAQLQLCKHSTRRGHHFIRKYMLQHGMAHIKNGKLVTA